MKLIRNPYFVLAAFIVATVLLMQAGPNADAAVEIAAWFLILGGSVVVVFRTFRRGGMGRGGYGQFALMSDRVRRWVLDKRD